MKFFKKYKPLLELNNSKYDVIALTGGRGSMKTGHALRGILQASMVDKKRTCFFRETKDTLNESLKSELDEIIERDFVNKGYSTTKETVSHVNGSYMFFKGLKEVNLKAIENLKGIATNTDYFVVDEAQAVSKSVWDVLIPTLRKKGCVLIVIYNRIADDLPVEECLFLDYETMTAPEGTYFVEVNYTDVLHLNLLSPSFLNRAELVKKNRPNVYQTVYLNKPKDKKDLTVVKYFNKEKHIKDFPYFMDEDLHITCDFNVDPMMWVIAHKDEQKVFFIDEIVMENTNVKETAKEFLNRYPKHLGKIIINGDASGNNRDAGSDCSKFIQLRNALLEFGYNDVEIVTRKGNPLIVNRIDAFNNKMLNDNGEPEIYFSSKCKWLLYNIKKLCFKTGTSIIDTPTPTALKNNYEDKFLGHIFDAASYLVEYYFPLKAQYPTIEQDKDKTIWEQYA